MAIQIRRGPESEFDASKMVSGELGVSTDGSHKVWATGAAGDSWELMNEEDVDAKVAAEAAAREQADTALQTAIDTKADTSALTVETEAREEAITDLKADLGKISTISANLYNAATNTPNKNVTDSKDIVDSSTRDLSDYIYVGENQKFTAKTATNADNTGVKKLVWCDAAKNIVSVWNNTNDVTQMTFNSNKRPYIRFVVMKSSEDFMVNLGDTLDDYLPYGEARLKDDAQSNSFLQLRESFGRMQDVYPIIEEWTDDGIVFGGGLINTSGTTVDVSAITQNQGWKHVVIPVVQGEQVKLRGAGGSSPRLWCFTDERFTVISVAAANAIISALTPITAPASGYLVCNFSAATSYSVQRYLPYTITDVKIDLSTNDIVFNGAFAFGRRADLSFDAPTISALAIPAIGDRLNYFYGLFDALIEQFPDYITKIDCDAEVSGAGIDRPAYMDGYPIYMYVFKPSFAPNNSDITVQATDCNVLKTMVIGGTHPEYLAIYDLYQMMRLVCESWQSDCNLEALRWETEMYVMPCQGAWCVENGSRYNYNGVDLNRNMATKDFMESADVHTGSFGNSEYESKVLAYYIEQIHPNVFVDHHNTNVSDTKNLAYSTCPIQFGIDIAGNFLSAMTRKVKKLYPDTFPMNDVIFGWCRASQSTGLRSVYACEHGALGYTFETNDTICYKNGEYFPDGAEKNTSLVCTIATDNIINFITQVLKMFSEKTNIYY